MLWIWKWISKLLPIIETQPMTVVAPATSLSIHQVLLTPHQVGANLQIRVPPLNLRQWTRSLNSKRWFIHYLSLQSWILILNFSSQHGLYHQNHNKRLPRNVNLCHFRDAQRPREIYQLESASESLSRELEDFINTNNSASNRYLH